MWMPPYSRCKAVLHAVPCALCLNSRGCKAMSCIRKTEVEEVLQAVLSSVSEEPITRGIPRPLRLCEFLRPSDRPIFQRSPVAVLLQYSTPHDRRNLDHSETIKIHTT